MVSDITQNQSPALLTAVSFAWSVTSDRARRQRVDDRICACRVESSLFDRGQCHVVSDIRRSQRAASK